MLYDRASLKFQAEAKARETYIFKKRSGSRSKVTQNDGEKQVKPMRLNNSQSPSLLSSPSEQLDSVKSQISITQTHIARSMTISDFEACSKAHTQLRKLLGEKQSLQSKLTNIESKHATSQKKKSGASTATKASSSSVTGTPSITDFLLATRQTDKISSLESDTGKPRSGNGKTSSVYPDSIKQLTEDEIVEVLDVNDTAEMRLTSEKKVCPVVEVAEDTKKGLNDEHFSSQAEEVKPNEKKNAEEEMESDKETLPTPTGEICIGMEVGQVEEKETMGDEVGTDEETLPDNETEMHAVVRNKPEEREGGNNGELH